MIHFMWDDESCDWRGLCNPTQVPRYRAIGALVRENTTVLDIGCGEGVLADFLPSGAAYCGIEPSRKAVELARTRCREKGREPAAILHDDAANFTSEQLWDYVVFNEMLYYSPDPLRLVCKYAEMLRPQTGRIIISIYQKPHTSTPKDRLLHLVNPRRPTSNLDCTSMVRKFIYKNGWQKEHEQQIAIPNSTEHWWLLMVQPTQSRMLESNCHRQIRV